MSKVLVVLHIFYHDQTDYFIEKLSHINGCEWDLLVTYTSENEATIRKIKEFKPDATLMKADNVGYDVLPFIKAIKSVDIDSYDYVLKLHTKNRSTKKVIKLNGKKLSGVDWGDLLVNSLLKSPEKFGKCLGTMENSPKIGMVCSLELYVGLTKRRAEDMSMLEEECRRIGLEVTRGKFCAGSMFLIRTECLKKIINSEPQPEKWVAGPSHNIGTMAHVYERIFCIAVLDAGYRCSTIATYPLNIPRIYIHKYMSYGMKKIFTIDRYGEDRRRCVTILGKRLMLKSGTK